MNQNSHDSISTICRLQDSVDAHHSLSLNTINRQIVQINSELRGTIQPLKTALIKMVHNPKQDWPCSLHHIDEEIQKLEKLHQESEQLLQENTENHSKEIPPLLSGDLDEVQKVQVEKILKKLEDMGDDRTEKISYTTQELTLVTQLYLAITDILRNSTNQTIRSNERRAQAAGRIGG